MKYDSKNITIIETDTSITNQYWYQWPISRKQMKSKTLTFKDLHSFFKTPCQCSQLIPTAQSKGMQRLAKQKIRPHVLRLFLCRTSRKRHVVSRSRRGFCPWHGKGSLYRQPGQLPHANVMIYMILRIGIESQWEHHHNLYYVRLRKSVETWLLNPNQ